MQKPGLIVFLALLLLGCSSLDSGIDVHIADGLVVELLPPASFGQQLMLTQAVTIDAGEERHELLVHSEITRRHIAIVGMSPGGIRLFSIVFDGFNIVSDGDQNLLGRISPAWFLADLQLSQWPLAAVSAALTARNACFGSADCALTESEGQLQRSLHKDNMEVISIRYTGLPHHQHTLVYQHHERAYRLQVQTLDVMSLQPAVDAGVTHRGRVL